ncbi:MAG: DUF4386 domain-containing protein [Gammaproteobacteria bacterium]|nr:DUF4386 domain-containing protein [Gammaproteobacteria bacterium]
MNSRKKNARVAGAIYFLLVITGVFSIMYVPATLIEFGDAGATAKNILSREWLYRLGIFVGLLSNIIFAVLGVALFRLFREIDEGQAFLMLVLVVMSATAGFVNVFNQLAALIFLSDAEFLAAIDKPQLEALAYAFIRLDGHATNALELFWGLWLLPFGLLVYRSRFIPKFFGVLLIIACVGYVLSSFMSIVLPQQKAMISTIITVLTVGELPIILWLLIVGAREGVEHQAS